MHREDSNHRILFHIYHFWIYGYTYHMSSVLHMYIFSKNTLYEIKDSLLLATKCLPQKQPVRLKQQIIIPCNRTKPQLRVEALWQFRALQTTTTCKDELFSEAKCWTLAWRILLQRQIAVALLFSSWSFRAIYKQRLLPWSVVRLQKQDLLWGI